MAKQKFPYEAFTLSPSMIIRPVKLIRVSNWGSTWHQTEDGKRLHTSALYATREEAVEVGETMLKSIEIRLNKSLENLTKRRANLEKAKKAK